MVSAVKIEEIRFIMDMVHPSKQHTSITSDMYDVNWKKVVWSDEPKINLLGSDGHKWMWKKTGEGLSDRVVQGTEKFGGGSDDLAMSWLCCQD